MLSSKVVRKNPQTSWLSFDKYDDKNAFKELKQYLFLAYLSHHVCIHRFFLVWRTIKNRNNKILIIFVFLITTSFQNSFLIEMYGY